MSKGTVLNLFLSTTDKKNPRKKVESIEVNIFGVINDKFYKKDLNRLILVTSTKSYDMAYKENIDLDYGDLGENIITDLSLDNIRNANYIEISGIKFKLTQNCTLCKGLGEIDKRLPKLLKDNRGVFLQALSNGKICINDEIIIT